LRLATGEPHASSHVANITRPKSAADPSNLSKPRATPRTNSVTHFDQLYTLADPQKRSSAYTSRPAPSRIAMRCPRCGSHNTSAHTSIDVGESSGRTVLVRRHPDRRTPSLVRHVNRGLRTCAPRPARHHSRARQRLSPPTRTASRARGGERRRREPPCPRRSGVPPGPPDLVRSHVS